MSMNLSHLAQTYIFTAITLIVYLTYLPSGESPHRPGLGQQEPGSRAKSHYVQSTDPTTASDLPEDVNGSDRGSGGISPCDK
jgi:hypothetical protein